MTSRLGSNGAIVKPSSNPRRQAVARAAVSRVIDLTTDTEQLLNPHSTFQRTHAPTDRLRHTELRSPPQFHGFIVLVVKAYHHYPNQEYNRVINRYIGSYSDLEEAKVEARKYYKHVTERAGAWGNYSWREHDNKWFLKAKNSSKTECWTIAIKMRRRELGPAEEEEERVEESASEESHSENESAEEKYSYVLKVDYWCDHFDQEEKEVVAVYSDLATANKAARKEYRKRCEDIGTEPDYSSDRHTAQDGRTSYKLEYEGEGMETWDIHLEMKPRR